VLLLFFLFFLLSLVLLFLLKKTYTQAKVASVHARAALDGLKTQNLDVANAELQVRKLS